MEKIKNVNPFRKLGLFEGFTICSAISKFGNQLYYFVIPLYIYEITGSGFAMGLGWFFQTIPHLLSPWIGRLIDMMERRNIFILSELLQLVLVLSIPLIISATGSENISVIYIFSTLMQSAAVASNLVSDYSFIPQFRRTDDLQIWNSYFITFNNIGRISGPALASVFITKFGHLNTLYLNSVTFLFTALFVLIFVPRSEQKSVSKDVKILDGVKVILNNKGLTKIVTSFLLVNLSIGGMTILYLFLMKSYWELDEKTIGIIMSLSTLTGVIGGVLGAKLFQTKNIITKLSIWTFILLLLMSPLITLNIYAVLVGFIFSQLCTSAMNVLFMSYRQEVIPTVLIGRANAFIRMVLLGAVPISSIILTAFSESEHKSSAGVFVVILLGLSIIIMNLRLKEKEKGIRDEYINFKQNV